MSKQANTSQARQMVSHAGIYAIGNILRNLTGFLMLPIYTRYLTPADYGVVGLMIFAISLLELVFGARLYWSIPKFYADTKDSNIKAKIVSTAMIITATLSLLTVFLMVTFRESLSLGLYGSPEFSTLVGFFSVLLLTQSLEQYALIYIRLQKRPWFYISINIVKLIIQLSFNIWFVVFQEMGAMGVAVSAMLASSSFALLLVIYTVRNVGVGFSNEIGIKLVRFCWPLWLSGFAGLYIGSANRYYLRIFSSLDDVGLFELAVKFSTIITYLVWEPFATYWQVERFNIYHREDAVKIFQNVFYLISTVIIVVALGVSIFSETVIYLMASEAFYASAKAVPFQALASVFYSLILFLNFSFLIKEKTGWMSRNNYLTAFVITIFYLFFIPLYGFVGASISMMLGFGVQFLIVYSASRRFYDMHLSLRPLFYMITVSIIFFLFDQIIIVNESFFLRLFYKVAVYTLACVLIVIPLLRREDFSNYFKKYFQRFSIPFKH